jgi:transcriptional regulator with XRE-family HTH domain
MRKLIGENIKQLRQKHSWTKTHMADLLGISVPTLSRIEAGRVDICLSRLYQIADVCGVGVLQLFSRGTQKVEIKSDCSKLKIARKNFVCKETELLNLRRKIIGMHEELHRHYKKQN